MSTYKVTFKVKSEESQDQFERDLLDLLVTAILPAINAQPVSLSFQVTKSRS
jgi:hypothetical protein